MLQVTLFRPAAAAHVGGTQLRRAQWRGGKHITRCSKESHQEVPSQAPVSASEWFVEQSKKPAFLIIQGLLGLGFLALLDGGLSGVPPPRMIWR